MAQPDVLPEKKPFIESSCLFTNRISNPFCNLHIDDAAFLEDVGERNVCPVCNKSRRYYCYNCYVLVPEIAHKIPTMRLPVRIDIIKHPKEVDGKSTSAHAAVLAPCDVKVFTYPDFPSYEKEKALLIFPGEKATELGHLLTKGCSLCCNTSHCVASKTSNECSFVDANSPCCPCNRDFDSSSITANKETEKEESAHSHLFPYDRVVFIDSTWRQTKQLYRNPQIRKLPCAVLTAHKSVFWRHQRGKPENYLSTIEAVYYFLVELHESMHPSVPYCGHFDNLLFFFKFMYYKIRQLYDPARLKAYQN